MKVIYGIGKVKKTFKDVVLAIGVFDGLHRGHQELIRRAVNRAHALKGKAFVLTFWPHPLHVLRPEIKLPLIMSLPHRLRLIEELGVAACIVLRFTKRFSQLTPQKFIQHYLVNHLRPKEVFVGNDFRFGQHRSGGLDDFQRAGEKYGFKVNVVDAVRQSGCEKIGSSHIRQLIREGKLDQAKELLGRAVSILGKVVQGDARGKTLGFPTANITPRDEMVPPLGVYAVRVLIGSQRFQGMANVGRRPSFERQDSGVNVEVHVFNFKKRLYGQEILIEFLQKIREEKTFPSQEDLITQLKKDKYTVASILLRPAFGGASKQLFCSENIAAKQN